MNARNPIATWLMFLLVASPLVAEDWPTYRHDNRRSGKTAEALPVEHLGLAWTWQSPQPPQPAWNGPARWDAFHNLRGLRSMRNYDPVFHLIAVGDAVYFGSSTDDSVRCLEAPTGKERWRFTADAPVRLAPTWAEGRLYFGADDGAAYCLQSRTGQRVWRYRPQPKPDEVLNNGRLISFWPVRTGVVVDQGTAYFGASLLPWKPSYLCAVDAATGRIEGAGRYTATFDGLTFEGAPLADADLLVVPQGRVAPLVFQRTTGRQLRRLLGGGGCFNLLTEDAQILHGPGNKAGWITSSIARTGAKLESYPAANAMVVAGNVAYVLTDRYLTAFDRATRKRLWRTATRHPLELIVAGETVFAGGADEVAAFRVTDGQLIWRHPVQGRAYGLAVANGALLVSTDEGQIACFTARGKPPAPVTTKTSPPRKPDRTAHVHESNTDPALLGHWIFHHANLGPSTNQVRDLAGTNSGTILGPVAFASAGQLEALRLDGQANSIRLATTTANAEGANLPVRALTAEAWVRVDAPQTWGGIVGAAQDNGDYERGWLLGYLDDQFSFALVATNGSATLGYLRSKTHWQPGAWYHVAGTYDGVVKKLYVNGQLEASSTKQSGDINYPPNAFYEIGAYHDQDEYFRMSGQIHEVRVYGRALSANEMAQHYEAKRELLSGPLPLVVTPYLRFVAMDAARISWKTSDPSAAQLVFDLEGTPRKFTSDATATDPSVLVTGLRKNRLYTYRIEGQRDGRRAVSPTFECDTFLNFSVPPVSPAAPGFPESPVTKRCATAARYILEQTAQRRGIGVVLGSGSGRLAYALAKSTELHLIGVDTNAARVAAARDALMATGCYGTRVTIRLVPDLNALPFPSRFADLVVSEQALTSGQCPGRAAEVKRLLRPGGLACLGLPRNGPGATARDRFQRWLGANQPRTTITENQDTLWLQFTTPELAGAGEWSHQYGGIDNAAFAGESLGGARRAADLEVQWIGRPGPRAQADRNGRKPSPLAANGRLFLQGNQRIVAINAYNGTILWSLDIPGFQRFNVPRDCSNWCADRDSLYAAVGAHVWQISAADGALQRTYAVRPGPSRDWRFDWGFVGRIGNQLLGSAVKHGSAFTNFWGGRGWYDAASGPEAAKVCSDNLFAFNLEANQAAWTYAVGLILNSTITAGDGRAYFVESRNDEVKSDDRRRITRHQLWQSQFLVALDLETGQKLWDQLIDTIDGEAVFYLAYGQEKLVLVSSGNKHYQVCAFDAANGRSVWQTRFAWPHGKADHGSHLSRPAIVGDRLYVRPRAFDLATGQSLTSPMPGGGCGTYAAAAGAFIFRAGNLTLWDPRTGQKTSWPRLRPDCWLSTIPACGMLLSPEGGGGCSCGSWLETSIGFLPQRQPRFSATGAAPPSAAPAPQTD